MHISYCLALIDCSINSPCRPDSVYLEKFVYNLSTMAKPAQIFIEVLALVLFILFALLLLTQLFYTPVQNSILLLLNFFSTPVQTPVGVIFLVVLGFVALIVNRYGDACYNRCTWRQVHAGGVDGDSSAQTVVPVADNTDVVVRMGNNK